MSGAAVTDCMNKGAFMNKKFLPVVFSVLVSSFAAINPVFASSLSCSGNGVPVVESITSYYNAQTGTTITIITYKCVSPSAQ